MSLEAVERAAAKAAQHSSKSILHLLLDKMGRGVVWGCVLITVFAT